MKSNTVEVLYASVNHHFRFVIVDGIVRVVNKFNELCRSPPVPYIFLSHLGHPQEYNNDSQVNEPENPGHVTRIGNEHTQGNVCKSQQDSRLPAKMMNRFPKNTAK